MNKLKTHISISLLACLSLITPTQVFAHDENPINNLELVDLNDDTAQFIESTLLEFIEHTIRLASIRDVINNLSPQEKSQLGPEISDSMAFFINALDALAEPTLSEFWTWHNNPKTGSFFAEDKNPWTVRYTLARVTTQKKTLKKLHQACEGLTRAGQIDLLRQFKEKERHRYLETFDNKQMTIIQDLYTLLEKEMLPTTPVCRTIFEEFYCTDVGHSTRKFASIDELLHYYAGIYRAKEEL